MTRLLQHRLILAVQNLRVSTDFWMSTLGFTRDFGDESDGWSWLSRNGVSVGLGECGDAPAASTLGDHSYARIRVVHAGWASADVRRRGIVGAEYRVRQKLMADFLRTPDAEVTKHRNARTSAPRSIFSAN